jgi:uncharacterized metal-binding protein YceD (DUF177 family)
MTKRPERAKDVRRAGAEKDSSGAPLTFNVSTLLQEPLGSGRSYVVDHESPGATSSVDGALAFDGEASDDNALVVDDERVAVSGEVELIRTDGSILAIATFDLAVREICDSCLEPYTLPLHLELREEFWPERDPLSQEVVEVPEEREGFPVVEGHIDLREAIRQYVEMARPMRAHCGDACPGSDSAAFVTVHSAESPGAPGESHEPPADDRWAALQALREDLDTSRDGGDSDDVDDHKD